ncbi:50S ribosomal protein L18 [bacterium]|jgi:large subunit ribosomal protein L18|nr:50S ribosomal protein L18 [bacterium]MBT4121624.1 50S ribosomal protein L18 [bacterium]MBT4335111.1 50S ribosomal protein L18 [bacterium]MBT4495274.1 50S ribosomal protein L18 [bacterium]MBT4763898.1 50S ribosomal protein L18 [bacterium]
MKDKNKIKDLLKARRTHRTRVNIFGTAKCPRLAVYKSLKHISIQAIDDEKGVTLASASDRGAKGKTRKDKAKEVGTLISKKLIEKKVTKCVFDKRHYRYHGLIKELADSARDGGLKF